MKNVYWFCFVLQIITDLGVEATKSYFTVSVDQKPGHSLAGLSAQFYRTVNKLLVVSYIISGT